EAVFIWTVVLGLYWRKANKYGAISSMISGMALYIFIDRFYPTAFGMHTVTIPIVASFIIFVIVSLATSHKFKDEHFLL
ncbi:MAG TPA: sodium/panthothenate symporter, partial [Lysinibacillus sp.]|nr:sodium/panthothenate symporter [Lysinibacillus sp.]